MTWDLPVHLSDEQLIKLRADYNRLTSEKEEYERAHKEAINELNRLRYSYDDLLGDREEMKSRIRELERALSSANESNKGEFLMRTEIDTLKMDLYYFFRIFFIPVTNFYHQP